MYRDACGICARPFFLLFKSDCWLRKARDRQHTPCARTGHACAEGLVIRANQGLKALRILRLKSPIIIVDIALSGADMLGLAKFIDPIILPSIEIFVRSGSYA